MRVNEAVVAALVRRGIDTVFGIPGTQSLPLNEAIEGRDDIRFVMARHETAVSHEAWGYAESSGRPAATCVIPGPGDLNAMNGLKNALDDRTPLLHLAVETDPELRGGGAIHETPPGTYDPVVKENVLIGRPEGTVADLERAIAIARTPPMGPVRVGVPKRFLSMDVTLAAAGPFPGSGVGGPAAGSIDVAVERLVDAGAPVIVAGGGVRRAEATPALVAVAERLDAPVVTTHKGKGVLPEDHPLFAGVLSVGASANLHGLLADADACLAVGTALDAYTTAEWTVDLPGMLVHAAAEPGDIGLGYDPTVAIVADVGATLGALRDALGAVEPPDGDGAARARAVRDGDAALMAAAVSRVEPPLTSAAAEAALGDALPADAIVTVDAGGFRIWALHAIETRHPRGFIDSASWASMGLGLPAAIGAKLANPDRDVVAITGEGGLMMCMHELHTAAREGIPVIVLVCNNDDYATISWEAAESFRFEPGAFAWPDVPVGFAAIAEGLGVRGVVAETPAAIVEAVEAARDRDCPSLIEVPTDPREPQAKPLR